ncbi:MAG TPA: hypothetical protein VF858_02275 [Gemmatimonadaceae bacterium]
MPKSKRPRPRARVRALALFNLAIDGNADPEVSCVTHGSFVKRVYYKMWSRYPMASVGRLYGSRLQKKGHLPQATEPA